MKTVLPYPVLSAPVIEEVTRIELDGVEPELLTRIAALGGARERTRGPNAGPGSWPDRTWPGRRA